jgi:hypothetical protein
VPLQSEGDETLGGVEWGATVEQGSVIKEVISD